MDKYDRLGLTGVSLLLGEGRKDESGDFTKGAGLSSTDIETIISIFEPVRDAEDKIAQIGLGLKDTEIGQHGREELEQISKFVRAAGYGDDRIVIDPSVVRGLEYYTGPVFEVDLTFSTDSAGGSPRFGSVGGGGRYDGLVSRFRGEPVPATGFSIGVSRLLAALQHLKKIESKAEFGPVVVTVFDKDRVADYQQMVARLRAANIRAELYLGNPRNLGNQLKYADRRNSPCVVIQGGDEKARGEVTIKDLVLGAELAKLEKGREEHLQKQGEAQRTVPERDLVTAVRAVLARHGLAQG
jgi:histidyl-tRNA synthetase